MTLTGVDNKFDFTVDKEGNYVSEHFLLNEDVSSFLIYTVLKDSIGSPNIKPLNTDSIQWTFEVTNGNFCYRVSDWQGTTWMISCFSKKGSSPKDAQKSTEAIEKLLVSAATKIKKIEDDLLKEKKERFIENPFKTYYDAATVLLNEAREIDTTKAESPEARNQLLNLVSTLCKAAFTSFLSSFEGCLNLVYEIYLNKALRENRIYERLGREQIDIKFRLIPFYCEGFSVKTLDSSDQRFKNFLKLVNLRNDFVHANITESMQQTIVRTEEFFFILNKKFTGELPNNINQLNIHHIEITNKYIDEAVNFIIENMETRTEREFKKLIMERHIRVEDVGGLIIPIL